MQFSRCLTRLGVGTITIAAIVAASFTVTTSSGAKAARGDRGDRPQPAIGVRQPETPFHLAQQSRVRRIRFEPGASSATLEDAVVRGTRDIYLIQARTGQTMTVKIVSAENNAIFAINAPPNKVGQRRPLESEATTWTKVLPATGDYQIIVGSTRGNAGYRLQVTIK